MHKGLHPVQNIIIIKIGDMNVRATKPCLSVWRVSRFLKSGRVHNHLRPRTSRRWGQREKKQGSGKSRFGCVPSGGLKSRNNIFCGPSSIPGGRKCFLLQSFWSLILSLLAAMFKERFEITNASIFFPGSAQPRSAIEM